MTTPSLIFSFLPPLPSLSLPLHPLCTADAIDENYGVAVVFHEEEGDEGAKMENVVSQEQDPTEVRRHGWEGGRHVHADLEWSASSSFQLLKIIQTTY